MGRYPIGYLPIKRSFGIRLRFRIRIGFGRSACAGILSDTLLREIVCGCDDGVFSGSAAVGPLSALTRGVVEVAGSELLAQRSDVSQHARQHELSGSPAADGTRSSAAVAG